MKPADDLGEAEVRIISDLKTGKVTRVEATMADGSTRILYPLTDEQIEEFERNLTATRH